MLYTQLNVLELGFSVTFAIVIEYLAPQGFGYLVDSALSLARAMYISSYIVY